MSYEKVLESIKINDTSANKNAKEAKAAGEAILFTEKEVVVAEPETSEIQINGMNTTGLVYLLNPALITRLFVNGNPLRARVVYYEVPEIQWSAGGGWPTYTSYCPREDTNGNMKFPMAKVQQIVPQFGGFYWTGCFNPGFAVGNQVTDVLFSVNDDKYDDNTGYFKVIITGWSV